MTNPNDPTRLCACVSIDPDTCAHIRYGRPSLTGRRIDDDSERDPCDCSCHEDADEPDDLDAALAEE